MSKSNQEKIQLDLGKKSGFSKYIHPCNVRSITCLFWADPKEGKLSILGGQDSRSEFLSQGAEIFNLPPTLEYLKIAFWIFGSWAQGSREALKPQEATKLYFQSIKQKQVSSSFLYSVVKIVGEQKKLRRLQEGYGHAFTCFIRSCTIWSTTSSRILN